MKIYLLSSNSLRQINEEINNIIKDKKNILTFDLSVNTLDDVLIEAGYVSMFNEEKYIIVRNTYFFSSSKLDEIDNKKLLNYLENPSSLSTIIFISNEKLDMRKKITKIVSEKYELKELPVLKYYDIIKKVKEYFQKLNYSIDDESLNYIVSSTHNNYDLSLNEAEKIVLYYNSPCHVQYEDILNIVSKSIQDDSFLFVNSVVENDLKKSLELFHDLLLMKIEPIVLLSLLARDFRIMLEIKTYLEENKKEYEISSILGLQNWQFDKYLKKLFPYKKEKLEYILLEISNMDLDIKSGKKDKIIALELLILDICE